MDAEQKSLINFINLHAHKATLHSDRRIHITQYNKDGYPLNTVLKVLSIDDIINNYDTNNKLVHWVIRQVSTYDVASEVVIGIEYPNKSLLAHVLKIIKDED